MHKMDSRGSMGSPQKSLFTYISQIWHNEENMYFRMSLSLKKTQFS